MKDLFDPLRRERPWLRCPAFLRGMRAGWLPQSGSDNHFCTTEDGSALVEIALVMPVMLMVMTAICTFAIGFNNQLTLTNAVGSGGQYLQLIRTTTSDPCQDTLSAIKSAAPSLTASSLSLTFNLNGTTVSGTSCPGDQSYLSQGTPVTVTAKYPCSLGIYATKFTSGCQLSASVTEYEY